MKDGKTNYRILQLKETIEFLKRMKDLEIMQNKIHSINSDIIRFSLELERLER